MIQKSFFNYLRVVLPMLLLFFGSIFSSNVWAGPSGSATYHAQLTVEAKPSGAGVVYIGNSRTTQTSTGSASGSGSASVNFSVSADANPGYLFEGWSDSQERPSYFTLTNATNCAISVSTTSTSSSSPESKTYYGYFVRLFQFKAQADFSLGSKGLGDVYVGWDATANPTYQEEPMAITGYERGQNDLDEAEKTKTAHFYAVHRTGSEFKGWCTTANGTTPDAGTNNHVSVQITSSTNVLAEAPEKILYAIFEKSSIPTIPYFYLEGVGVSGPTATIKVGDQIRLVTNTMGRDYTLSDADYVDKDETEQIVQVTPKGALEEEYMIVTANRAGTITLTVRQEEGEHDGVLWTNASETFTFVVEKNDAGFTWKNPLPTFSANVQIPISTLFSTNSDGAWTLTSNNTAAIPNITSGATALTPQEVAQKVILTFDQTATYKYKAVHEQLEVNVNDLRHVAVDLRSSNPRAGDTFDALKASGSSNNVTWNGTAISSTNAENELILDFVGIPDRMSFTTTSGIRTGTCVLVVSYCSLGSTEWVPFESIQLSRNSSVSFDKQMPVDADKVKFAFNVTTSKANITVSNLQITEKSGLISPTTTEDIVLNYSDGLMMANPLELEFVNMGDAVASFTGTNAAMFKVGLLPDGSDATASLELGNSLDKIVSKNIYVRYAGEFNDDNIDVVTGSTAVLHIQGAGIDQTFNVRIASPEYVTFEPAVANGMYSVKYPDMASARTISAQWKRPIYNATRNVATLKAIPSSEQYALYGWYIDDAEAPFSREDVLNTSLSTPQTISAKFFNLADKPSPVIRMLDSEGGDVVVKITDELVLEFVNVADDFDYSNESLFTVTELSRVDADPLKTPIISYDAATRKLKANRAGVAKFTIHHDETRFFKGTDITFIVTVEKLKATVEWKTTSLLAGQEYQWSDIIETPSEGAWNLVSSTPTVFATLGQDGATSTTANVGTTILTFSQAVSYLYDAIPSQSKELKVYSEQGLAEFKVGTNYYTDLNKAIAAAIKLSGNKYIFVNRDGVVLPGLYEIPSDITLVVPYESTYSTTYITRPKETVNVEDPIYAFRTLTLLDGVEIALKGSIAVCGQIQSGDASHNPSGYPAGPVGCIDMGTGGCIRVKDGGNLYAWGLIKGQGYLDGNNTQRVGTIKTESGATIWETFGMGDWGGGGFASACVNDKGTYRHFPFQGYFVQNIEVPVHIVFGANERLRGSYYMSTLGSDPQSVDAFNFIGSNDGVMFRITSPNGYVTKWYDPTTDHLVVQMEGTTKMDNLSLKVYVNINSMDYDLPILSNMHIKFKNTNLELTTPVMMQPGCIFEIMKGSQLTLKTNMFVYDTDQWGKYTSNGKWFCPLPTTLSPHYSVGLGTEAVNPLSDAQLIVDGNLLIEGNQGALCTSLSGANIMGNGGGRISWNISQLPLGKYIYANKGKTNVGGSLAMKHLVADNMLKVDMFAGVMHNDNDSYTAPAANTSFVNIHGRWFKSDDAEELADHTYKFTYINGTNDQAIAFCVYSADKTGLTAGYKWVNVTTDSEHANTFLGEDGNFYNWTINSEWLQLVATGNGTYAGSDDNLYTYVDGAWHKGAITIGSDCLYDFEGTKKALVGSEFIAVTHDEFDEVFVDAEGNYYMLFDGCVWQHATKVPNTYKAYIVQDNFYVWIDETWTLVERENESFFIRDDQNIKHYYEYDNALFAWVPVKYKVRVTGTDVSDYAREFRAFDEALQYASQYTNPTITLLDDASGDHSVDQFAPSAKSTTCTIDLNGHTATVNVGAAEYGVNINTSSIITITDSSEEKNGELRFTSDYNGQFKGFKVTKGQIVMENGKVYAENLKVYASDDNHKNVAAAVISAVAGQKAWITVNGGELEAMATRNAYAVYAASTAADNNAKNSRITINGGELKTAAPTNAYGVFSYGDVIFNGGTISPRTETFCGVAAASGAYGIYLQVSASAVDANSYRATLSMTGGTINAISTVSTAYGIYSNASSATANGKKSDGTTDRSYNSTDGTYSNKAAAHFDITGGTINAICGTTGSTACGIYDLGCYNSYTDKSEAGQKANTIKNVKIRAKANGTAYGILVAASIADYSAGRLYGNVIVDNVDSHAETFGSTNAYGIYINATALWLNRYRYYNISAANRKTWYVDADNTDGDITHEAIAQTGTKIYKYQIGNYTLGAKAVINSGTFYGKAGTTNGYGILVNSAASSGDNSRGYADVTINGGTFTGESVVNAAYGLYSLGNTTVNGGTFNAITGTTEAYGVMAVTGVTTLKSGVAVNATSNGSTAVGVAASGTVDTNTGTHAHGTLNVENGVVVNARSLTSSTVYGAYATGSAQELTQAKYDARSADNKKQYFCVAEDGTTITTQATSATTNDSKKQNFYAYRIGTYIESGIVNVKGGTFNVNAYTSTAAGVATATSNIVRTTEIGRFGTARGTVNVNGGTFNVTTETGATAMGVRSYGIVNVEGGIFNMTPKTTNAEGVRVYDGTTTINGGTFNINAMTTNAYGVYTTPDYDTNYGYAYSGEIIVNGGTFNVKTYGGDTSYGAYSTGGAKVVGAAKVSGKPNTDIAVAGSITINGGEFTMTPSSGKAAYGMVVSAPNEYNAVKAYSRGTINGGFFKMVGTSSIAATGSSAVEDGEGVPQLQVKGGHFSTKANLEQASPKNYVRDPYQVIACVHPDYQKDYPFEVAEVCTITFNDNEGNLLWTGLQPKGTMAIYPLSNGIPEKTSPSYSYDFTGWESPLEIITDDATYVANFNQVARRFLVTWKDEAGNEIDHKEYASGETPSHDDPVKEGHTFNGWNKPFAMVTDADQEYKSTGFTPINYTIVWLDEDGSEIKRETKPYGSTLTAPNPTKVGYSFKVWTPGVEKVTGDQTYQASYLLNVAEVTDASTGKTTPYTTWADALKAANALTAGGTLKVLDDIKGLGVQTVTQTFTLDLNGHTLASASSKFITMGTAGKTLTIDDSQGGGRIEMIGNSAAQMYAVYISNGAVALAGGTIYGENVYATADDSYRGEGVYVEAAGKFNMTGGTVEAVSKNMAFAVYAMGPVNITGGTLNATARTKARGIYVAGAGTNTLTNLQTNATTTVAESAIAVFVGNQNNPTVKISGGKFTAVSKTTKAYALDVNVKSTVTVDGTELYAEATDAGYGIKTDVTTATTTASNLKVKVTTAPTDATATATGLRINSGYFDKADNLSKYIGTKKVVTLNPTTDADALAEGYRYKIVDAAYQITFCAGDGTELQRSNVEKDVRPTFLGEEPTKPATPKMTYVFAGWTDGVNTYASSEIPVATAAATYTATFAGTTIEYPITFSNIDGKGGSHVQMVAYGETPVYEGPAVVMSGNVGDVVYLHSGWSPELEPVVGATTYTATFRLQQAYQLTYKVKGEEEKTAQVAEGAKIEERVMEKDGFRFDGWYKNSDCSAPWDFQKDEMPEQAMTLYGRWIVVLDVNGAPMDEADFYNAKAGKNLFAVASTKESYEALSDKTNVLFGNKVSSLVLTDKADFALPVSSVTASDLTYTRTLYYGYNTVTLPFDFSVADLNNAGAYGCQILLVNGYVEGVLELVDVHDDVVEAGTPCLVWLPSSTATYTITKSLAEVSSAAPAERGNDEAKMYGTYVEDKVHVGPGFFGIGKSGEALAKVPGTAYITPFRGSINIPSAASASAAPRIAIVSAPQLPTDVEQTSVRDDARKVLLDNRVYILRGKKMFTIDGTLVR